VEELPTVEYAPDGSQACLLADPRNPGRVTALFALPGRLRPGPGGAIEGAWGWPTVLLLMLAPVAVVAAVLLVLLAPVPIL